MCGIAGLFNTNGGLTEKSILSIRDALAHRGPDGGQSWVSTCGRVALGHRRLSIIDLSSAANQPMIEKHLALVFNGEIYNHSEIRTELERLGHTDWQTSHSDTEVILKAYKQWGVPGCLEHLNGMFALALWDGKAEKLYLARDRVGEKPLYYATAKNGDLVFASEIKALLKHPGITPQMDEIALHDYLTFLMVPPPRTMLKGIYKLAAGHWGVVAANGTVTTERYWDPLKAATEYAKQHAIPANEEGWIEAIKLILERSVQMRQEAADVPVGVFLSGGIDSSAIAALASRSVAKGKLKTFAVGPDASYPAWPDETPYATHMAEQIQSQHTTLRVSEAEMLAALPDYIALQDEPLADPSALPLFMLAKAATGQGKLKVCQGGEGGDELFIGYNDWLKFEKLNRWNRWPIPRFVKTLGYKALILAGQGPKFWVEYLRRGGAGEPIFWGGAEAFTLWEKQQLLGPTLAHLKARSSYETIRPFALRFKAFPQAQKHFWNWCSWLELQMRLPEQLLMRADKTTMATALELRLPLLDPTLIAAVLNTPEGLRVKGGNKKHLLKAILQGVVPETILNRPKQGLGMPLNSWILGRYGEFAKTELEAFCRETGYLNWAYVQQLFSQKRGQHVWYLLNLALWYRQTIGHTVDGKPMPMPQ